MYVCQKKVATTKRSSREEIENVGLLTKLSSVKKIKNTSLKISKCLFLSCKVDKYGCFELHARNKHLEFFKEVFFIFLTPQSTPQSTYGWLSHGCSGGPLGLCGPFFLHEKTLFHLNIHVATPQSNFKTKINHFQISNLGACGTQIITIADTLS